MTPQLVDHAHTDSYIVIGCNLMQPRRKTNRFKLISGCSHIAAVSHLYLSRSCITVIIVNDALKSITDDIGVHIFTFYFTSLALQLLAVR